MRGVMEHSTDKLMENALANGGESLPLSEGVNYLV